MAEWPEEGQVESTSLWVPGAVRRHVIRPLGGCIDLEGEVEPALNDPLREFWDGVWWPTEVDWFGRLQEAAGLRGWSVDIVPALPRGAIGQWRSRSRTIVLADGYSRASMTRTVLHEMAHALDPRFDRSLAEVVAESVAFIAGTTLLGIDMVRASSRYLALWGATWDVLLDLAGPIFAVTNRLADVVAPAL
jgi:hypothetical protein